MKWLHMINRLWKNIGKKGRYGVAVVIGLEGAHLLYISYRHYFHHKPNIEEPFPITEQLKQKSAGNKMILVMDLDETMVYTRRKVQPPHENYQVVKFNEGNMYIEFRPYLKEYLSAVGQLFTIYVYTAGTQPYADLVLNILDDKKLIEKRFYRESCRLYRGSQVKDLKKIQQSGHQMILVDDNPDSIMINVPYAIKAKPFFGDQNDCQLIEVIKEKYCRQFYCYMKDLSQTYYILFMIYLHLILSFFLSPKLLLDRF